MRQKGSTLNTLLILVTVIVLIAGGYYLYKKIDTFGKSFTIDLAKGLMQQIQQSQAQTKNWTTYLDPKGLFTIQYPDDTKVSRMTNPPLDLLTDLQIKKDYPSGPVAYETRPFYLNIMVSKNTQNLTITKLREDISKSLCPDIKPYQKGEINGLYYTGCVKGRYGQIYQQQKITHITQDKIYDFTFTGAEGEGADISPEETTMEYINKILSTLKFSNPTIDTSNWKVYTKDNLWSIKYPNSWYLVHENNNSYIGVSFADTPEVNNAVTGNISVSVTWAKKNSSYDSIIAQEVGQTTRWIGNTETILKKLNIDGNPGILEEAELDHIDPAKPSYQYQALISGPLTVNITANALKYSPQEFSKEDYNNIYLPIFINIISTFKFLN